MPVDEQKAAAVAELFHTLSDPTRVRIISALVEGEMSVGSLAEAIGMERSAVSHQLSLLRHMRLVRARKIGRQVIYCLDDEHVVSLYRRGLDHVQHS